MASHHFLRGGAASGFVPAVSREIYDSVCAHIYSTSRSPYIAQRDLLFLDIAANAGFRRGSIHSLSVDQFDRDALEETEGLTAKLKPAAQKFGYDIDYDVGTMLMLRVVDFIEGVRAELLADLGVSERKAEMRVFLSAKTGRQMTDRAMTQRISRAMRAVGCAKGQAIHVFRGLYANEQVDDEIVYRLETGLDTSTESIASAVAPMLGQKSAKSLFTYIASKQTRNARQRHVEQRLKPTKVVDPDRS